jgi:peptidoglycan/xylan/chitin deacetylase (PgdA/CDA1 family)
LSKAAVLPFGLPARRRAGDIVILLYHRVGPGSSQIELSAEELERQLAFLAHEGLAIGLHDALGGRGGVVVTFDDGTRDFHEAALPLLVRHGVPAVLYLATGGVANGAPDPSAISWQQLAESVSTGLVTVGSHTHTHANLTDASEHVAEDEMRRSKELIEDRLGVDCRHFAYPWAVAGPAADRVARRLFDSAAWDAWRTNRAGHTDPHRLGRVPILRDDGGFFFRRKAAGQLDTEAWLYRALGRGPWGRA